MLKEKLKELKLKILCSRPFLAIHILCGNPVCYKMNFLGTWPLDKRNLKSTRIVSCNFEGGVYNV